MASSAEFPIRTKLLLLMTGLVLAATGGYLALSLKVFNDDKTSLVYELNASNVKTLSAQTEASLGKIADKIKLLTQGHREEAWSRAIFEAEPDLIAYTLYQPTADANVWNPIASVRNPQYLKLYGLPSTEIDELRTKLPIPFAKILAKRSWVMNSTVPGGAPILTLAMAVEIRDKDLSGEFVAVADLRLDRILKVVSGRGVATVYIVDGEGNVIAHPDVNLVSSRASLAKVPIVRDSAESPVALQLKRFEMDGKPWIGAYSSVGIGGLSVISQVEEAQAFLAAQQLTRKTLLFALIFITAGLLISGWLARTFTQPLELLLGATEKLARWEFGESVHVKTRDEIGKLARAFNSMASDLQTQRAQLDRNRQELEIKVKERTAALEEQKKQLAEAQDSLIRTTRLASLGELAGAAAHEILNPLNNMNIRLEKLRTTMVSAEKNDVQLLNDIVQAWKGAYQQGGFEALKAELLKAAEAQGKTLLDEDLENLTSIAVDLVKRADERSEDLEFLSREIIRVTRIINNMRSLSRVGGERRPLDIHGPIEDTAITLADLFEKRKVDLVKEFGAESRDLYAVIGDRDELVQVFSNLLRNSLHAVSSANRRAGVIRIGTRRADSRIEVRIMDNGTGIAAENLPRIFEPTFTTKSVEEGTGLGLSISRRLVRAFGGDIEVEKTAEGEGTTFLVWFPVVKA